MTMKTQRKRKSTALWDIIVRREAGTLVPPVKQPRVATAYTPKVHVSLAVRKASKESGGIPTQSLDAAGRRERSKFLRRQRQQCGG